MAGRLMGQLQAAARTSGVSDLIDLMKFLGQVEWAEELEAFKAASAKAEEAAAVLGSVEEIEALRDEAEQALGKAAIKAEQITDEAHSLANTLRTEMDDGAAELVAVSVSLDARTVTIAATETDQAAREEKLVGQEALMVSRIEACEAEQERASATKVEYEELIAQVQAALPRK